jgi:hypothetical protein
MTAMSMANLTAGNTGPQQPGQHWQPGLTRKEAVRIGISGDEYGQAYLHARMTVEEHQALGTPRDRWEPPPMQNESLAAPFIADGEQELARRLETEADPALANSSDLIENVKANLDEIAEHTPPIVAPESGANYSAAEAVERVGQHDVKIRQHEEVGKHHHDRVGRWLKRVAACAPWLEAAGFLTFITYYLNVPLLEPWQGWLAWSFALTVVVVVILGQTWLVRHAARSHNHAREASADGNRFEAEKAFTRRNLYLAAAGVTAVGITGGMIWRGIAALGSASFVTTALLVFLAAITGVLLPTLTYLVIALDGSKVSRERDSLAQDLDDALDSYLDLVDNMRRDLAEVAEISETLRNKTFPDICNTTQEVVDGAYRPCRQVRLLIGGLADDPPAKTAKTLSQDADGGIHGYIGTSIPGAGQVNLDPLFDRFHYLVKIENQRTSLLTHVDALPQHPWGAARTA